MLNAIIDLLAKEKWTVVTTTTFVDKDETIRVQWREPGSKSDAINAAKQLNAYSGCPSWSSRMYYEAMPLSKAREMGFSDEELGVGL